MSGELNICISRDKTSMPNHNLLVFILNPNIDPRLKKGGDSASHQLPSNVLKRCEKYWPANISQGGADCLYLIKDIAHRGPS